MKRGIIFGWIALLFATAASAQSDVGVPVYLNLANMTPGGSYAVTSTDGDPIVSVLGYDPAVFSAVTIDGATVTMTAAAGAQPLAGTVQIGIGEVWQRQASFTTNAPASVAFSIDGATNSNGVYTVPTTNRLPQCVFFGDQAGMNKAPMPQPYGSEGYNWYLAEHHWYACRECPGSCLTAKRGAHGRPAAIRPRMPKAGAPAAVPTER